MHIYAELGLISGYNSLKMNNILPTLNGFPCDEDELRLCGA
jgi:hypothetical protein